MSEQDQWQSRRLTHRKKTETLGMDEPVEIHKTHGSASTDPIPQSLETSIAQRSTPCVVLEERNVRGKNAMPTRKAKHNTRALWIAPKPCGKTRSSHDCSGMLCLCGQSSKK